MLLGVPVNPNARACPRFVVRDITSMLPPQKSLGTPHFSSLQIRRSEKSEIYLADLKRRVDVAEIKLRKIKGMLKSLK